MISPGSIFLTLAVGTARRRNESPYRRCYNGLLVRGLKGPVGPGPSSGAKGLPLPSPRRSDLPARSPPPEAASPTSPPWASRVRPKLLRRSPHDLLRLVVPKELRAPVLKHPVERQVLGVAPPSADRARKPSPLAAKPGLAHPRADHRFFGLTRNPCPPILFLRYPAGRRLGCPMPKRGAPRRPWPALSMSLSRRCPPSAGRSERGRRPGTPPAR